MDYGFCTLNQQKQVLLELFVTKLIIISIYKRLEKE